MSLYIKAAAAIMQDSRPAVRLRAFLNLRRPFKLIWITFSLYVTENISNKEIVKHTFIFYTKFNNLSSNFS